MASNTTALETVKRPSLVQSMAEDRGIAPDKFLAAIKATVFKDGTDEQLMAFLMVANKYNLDPILKEIYAFQAKGGIMPIVSIDGWTTLINRQAAFDGIEFVENFTEKGELDSITAKIYRKDRSRATIITEYYSECKRQTEPWSKWPIRMLRHKALIQCARVAFSISGVVDEDEAGRFDDLAAGAIEGKLSAETLAATNRTEAVKAIVGEKAKRSRAAQVEAPEPVTAQEEQKSAPAVEVQQQPEQEQSEQPHVTGANW